MRGGALRDGKRVGESKGGVRRATSCVSQPSSLYSGVRFQLKLWFITVPVRCFLTSQPAVACAKLLTFAIDERTQSFISVCSSTFA